MAMKIPYVVIVDVTGTIDRSEFWRDAEAAQRLWSPWAAARFLASLCRTRAIYETTNQTLRVVDAMFDLNVEATTLSLWRECQARGLFVVPLRRTKIEIVAGKP
jgi:hypothetical protein